MNTQTLRASLQRRGRRAAPQRLALCLALAAALSPGLADARDLYWKGGTNVGTNLGAWSAPSNWLVSPGTATQPAEGDSLHFQGSKTTNINDLGYRVYNSITFEAGASSFTLNGAPNNIGLTGGVRNLSSNVQTLDWGSNNGIVIAADQVWDGGTAGLVVKAGNAQSAALTLQNKVSFTSEQYYASGASGRDDRLTVRANSSYSSKLWVTLGAEAGASGSVYVQGVGSSLAAGTDLVVGDLGTGFLQVENGATATSNALYFGRSGGSGTLNVTGTNSSLTTLTATLTEGAVAVKNGGLVKASDWMKIADYGGVASTVTVQDAGSQLQVTNGLTVGAGGNGQLIVLTGGSASAGQLLIGAGGAVNLQGGTLKVGSASLANGGAFNFAAGVLNYTANAATGDGTLLGSGGALASGLTLKADAAFSVVDGTSLSLLGGNVQAQSFQVAVQGSLSVGLGSTLTGTSVLNLGTLQLNGGRINGAFHNQGYLSGAGYVGGKLEFNNFSRFDQTGFVELDVRNAYNNGTWNLQGGRDLTLRDTVLSNYATLNIEGAKITGAGPSGGEVRNLAGGTVTGNGILQVPFDNAGRLIVQGGSFGVVYTLQNTGQILLNSTDASLVGATITNTGRIEGLGQIGNAITNTGAINALGGTLTLSSKLTNSGIVAASRDAAIFLQAGLAPNAGKIQLSGGTLDTNGTAFTNTAAGTISGYGDVRSGLLTNNGRLQMSGGVSAIYADVLTTNLSKILLSGNSNTTFYGKVDVQSGAELRVSAGSTATFFEKVQQRTGSNFTGDGTTNFEGGLSVGASPGLGTAQGNVSFGYENVYEAEIGGVTACTLACGTDDAVKNSSFDKYVVGGRLSLGGTLKLVSWNGFVVQAGQSFDLLDWGTMRGSFAAIDASDLKLAPGTKLDYGQLYATGEISVTAVPEPSTYALWLAGLSVLPWLARRRPHGRAFS